MIVLGLISTVLDSQRLLLRKKHFPPILGEPLSSLASSGFRAWRAVFRPLCGTEISCVLKRLNPIMFFYCSYARDGKEQGETD